MPRTLLMLAGLLLAAPPVYADEAEDKAAEFFENFASTIERDDKIAGHRVVGIMIGFAEVEDLKRLDAFKKLKKVRFARGNAPVPGEVVKELGKLGDLRDLDLTNVDVTDDQLKDVARCKFLEALIIGCPAQVTGKGLENLSNLKGLHSLNLSRLEISDGDLKPLAGITNLRELNLQGTKTTGTGLKELAKLQNLQILNLEYCPISEDGLKQLPTLKSLRTLAFRPIDFNEDCLEHVGKMKGLRSLEIVGIGRMEVFGPKEVFVISDGSGKRLTEKRTQTSKRSQRFAIAESEFLRHRRGGLEGIGWLKKSGEVESFG